MSRYRYCRLVLLLVAASCRQAGPTAQDSPCAAGTQPVAISVPRALSGGWEAHGEARRFIGQDLFNHIDGAAELWLEMGFRAATVQRYRTADEALELEVYEMDCATGARGMFLRLRGAGATVAGVAGRHCGNRHQLLLQKGRYCIQVNNASGFSACQPAMIELANRVWNALPADEAVDLVEMIPREDLRPGSEVIFRGPYSLQSVYYFGEGDVLKLEGRVFGVAADYDTKEGGVLTHLSVPFESSAAARAAYEHALSNVDATLVPVRVRDNWTAFRDSTGRSVLIGVHGRMLSITINVASVGGG